MNYIFLAWKTPPNIPRSPCPFIILHMQGIAYLPNAIFQKPRTNILMDVLVRELFSQIVPLLHSSKPGGVHYAIALTPQIWHDYFEPLTPHTFYSK